MKEWRGIAGWNTGLCGRRVPAPTPHLVPPISNTRGCKQSCTEPELYPPSFLLCSDWFWPIWVDLMMRNECKFDQLGGIGFWMTINLLIVAPLFALNQWKAKNWMDPDILEDELKSSTICLIRHIVWMRILKSINPLTNSNCRAPINTFGERR